MSLPRTSTFDETRAFFREGYSFINTRCHQLKTDAFRTRILLRPVVCIMGEDAARRFYDGAHFTRAGAMPQITLRLLQDKGSVQSLDGEAHRARKAMFLDLLTGSAVTRLGDMFADQWMEAAKAWRRQGTIVVHEAMTCLLCDVACAWAGVPVSERELTRRTQEMAAMIEGAGKVGPRAWRALLLRRRAERWARKAIVAARHRRGGEHPVDHLARFHDGQGRELDSGTAGIELLNIIRPTVAVARFITFAALALHEHPQAARWLAESPTERMRPFVDEVRRYYPFFPVIGGRVRRPCTWRDHVFARGDWVLLGLYATNHDERLWADPKTFLPERFVRHDSSGFDLVPQGAGDHLEDHRCPGEWFTTELLSRAVMNFLNLSYTVPSQDLHIPINRFPTLPASGLRLALT